MRRVRAGSQLFSFWKSGISGMIELVKAAPQEEAKLDALPISAGDKERVVGYASFAFCPENGHE